MDAKDFVKKIKQIENELLALKQYKKYGLNRTNFTTFTITKPLSSTVVDIELVLQVDSSSNTEPFVELLVNNFEYCYIGIYSWNWDSDTKKITINFEHVSWYGSESNISIISTKPIVDWTWEEV